MTDLMLLLLKYLCIFALGFMVGRIATMIRVGMKYDKEFKELKERYEKKLAKKFKQKTNNTK